ncbi:DUF7426 family protein [Blastococcus sp. SYSU D00813]
MALEEAAAWLTGDLLLPIAGKQYRVPEYSAEVGVRVEILLATGRRVLEGGQPRERDRQMLDDEQEQDLYRDVLGSAYDQLLADVSWPMLRHCALTAMYHFNVSEQVAEAHWNSGAAEAGKAASRSSRPATRRTTAAATTTKRRASGSGTRSRQSS